jgi:glutamate/tyrosine decarboxylase-like PLP-dependent enzyme
MSQLSLSAFRVCIRIKPNLVISTAYQAAWEKFFRNFDVEPILVHPNLLDRKMAIDAKHLVSKCIEKTLDVVASLATTIRESTIPPGT